MSWRSWTAGLAVVLLAACSGGDDDGAGAAGTTVAAASTVAPATTATGSAASSPSAPTAPVVSAVPTVEPSPPTTAGVAPEGFEQVAGLVTAADGSTCDVCLWLAATPAERAQGLMGVTDLSGADGMAFRWDEPSTGNFWMRDTPLPLSIAFFAPDGSFVSSADMVPCLQPTPDAECARYPAAGPYQYAVEVAAGGLPALLMGPGSRLDLVAGSCPRSG